MQLILSFLRFYLIYSVVKIVLRFIIAAKSKQNQQKTDPIEPLEKFAESEKDKKEVAIDMVFDEICGAYVPENKAYQIVEDDGIHYFCSWECRKKYIEKAPL